MINDNNLLHENHSRVSKELEDFQKEAKEYVHKKNLQDGIATDKINHLTWNNENIIKELESTKAK